MGNDIDSKPRPPVPGQTHPDVERLKRLFLNLRPGESISYDAAASELGLDLAENFGILRSRSNTARKQLRAEGLANIAILRGVGFVRQMGHQADADAIAGRKGMHRKAIRIGQALAIVDPSELSEEQRKLHFAARTINNVLFVASGSGMGKRLLAEPRTSEAELPFARALALLSGNGEAEKETTEDTEDTEG